MGIGAGIGLGNAAASLASGILSPQQTTDAPPQLPTIGKKYYFAVDEKQQGPVSAEVIVQKYTAEEINMDTLVWRKGMEQWRKLSECEDFSSLISSEVPPPMPNT